MTANEEDTAGDIPYARGSYIRASVHRAKMKRYDSGLERRRRRLSSLRHARETEAAAIIQCTARRCLAIKSMTLLKRRKAAVAIQRYARGSDARTLARNLREMQRAMAALRIQRAFRGYHVRCRPVLRRTAAAPSPDNSIGFGRSWTTRKSNVSRMLGSNRHDSSKVVGSEPTRGRMLGSERHGSSQVVGSEPTRGSEVEGGNDTIITTSARYKNLTSRVSSASRVQGSKPWQALDGDDSSSMASIRTVDLGTTVHWDRIKRDVRKNQAARESRSKPKVRTPVPSSTRSIAANNLVKTRRRLAKNYGPYVPWYDADDDILRRMDEVYLGDPGEPNPHFSSPKLGYYDAPLPTLIRSYQQTYGRGHASTEAHDVIVRAYRDIHSHNTYVFTGGIWGYNKMTKERPVHHGKYVMAELRKVNPAPDEDLSLPSPQRDADLDTAIELRCHIVMQQLETTSRAALETTSGAFLEGVTNEYFFRRGELALESAQCVRSDIGRLLAFYKSSHAPRSLRGHNRIGWDMTVANYIDVALDLATQAVVKDKTNRYEAVTA
ncbi:hypothetical protein THAOC_07648 [Thalassiosira oceanica]|uniref:Uncharacterized protein n=1 Tax=Thalassiosira oceanica TaxID=159749 RepID=K0SX01_THAOC|nr:hypothetical protein THAOC_07648 [Thalassiosira oceanica]|eukprot:EJK70953.1 hypothetical protein THAOC_07648 [Thalassiosira oceanica]